MATNNMHPDSAMGANSKEHKPALDEADVDEAKIIGLRGHWEKQMRHFSPKKKHSKVEVLLLYWDKLSESYLDTDKEVTDRQSKWYIAS
jgi:hypothetical protein